MKELPVLLKEKNHGFVVVHFDFSGPFGSAAAHCFPLKRRAGAESTPKYRCSRTSSCLSKPVFVGQG
jgi:hypothetical protein